MASSSSTLDPRTKDDPRTSCWNDDFKQGKLTKYEDFDIVIEGDRVLRVHKCVLASRSPVFAAMFQSGVTQMEILDFDYDTVIRAIYFCYSDLYFFRVKSICNLIKFGHKYDFQHLIRACLHQLKDLKKEFDNSERKFIVKSAFDLGANEIIEPILDIFVEMKGELVADCSSCPYPTLGEALAKEEHFRDLKIICDDGTEFSVHKYILAFRIDTFAEIFEKMAQNGDTSGRWTIDKIKSAAVQKAIEFLYNGYITNEAFENNPQDLIGLLEFADRFQLEELVSFCLQKINQYKNKFDTKVVSTYIQTAAHFESKKILRFIKEIFGTLGLDPFDFKKASEESYSKYWE